MVADARRARDRRAFTGEGAGYGKQVPRLLEIRSVLATSGPPPRRHPVSESEFDPVTSGLEPGPPGAEAGATDASESAEGPPLPIDAEPEPVAPTDSGADALAREPATPAADRTGDARTEPSERPLYRFFNGARVRLTNTFAPAPPVMELAEREGHALLRERNWSNWSRRLVGALLFCGAAWILHGAVRHALTTFPVTMMSPVLLNEFSWRQHAANAVSHSVVVVGLLAVSGAMMRQAGGLLLPMDVYRDIEKTRRSRESGIGKDVLDVVREVKGIVSKGGDGE